jgi:hypothetical protein
MVMVKQLLAVQAHRLFLFLLLAVVVVVLVKTVVVVLMVLQAVQVAVVDMRIMAELE